MQKLSAHHNNIKNLDEINVSFEQLANEFKINYKVRTQSMNISFDKFNLSNSNNWELWEFDVVEAFLKREKTSEYLEVQASPIGQRLALHIVKPRVEYSILEHHHFRVEHSQREDGFDITLIISLSDIPGDGDIVFGNVFSCLGLSEERCFYGLTINKDERADFHRPELFQNLTALSEKL